jgi:hypothetical protein
MNPYKQINRKQYATSNSDVSVSSCLIKLTPRQKISRVSILGVITLAILSTELIKPLCASTESSNDPQIVALESHPAPSELGGTYARIGSAAIDDTGEVAFIATLLDSTASSAIFLRTGENTRALIKAGESSPVGGKYKSFAELDLARFTWLGDEGVFLLFRAELDESSSPEGIFLWTPEKVEAIAIAGNKSPRGTTYKAFSQPIIMATSGNTGVNFFLSFIAVMDNDSKSIVQKSSSSLVLEEPLATGDKLERSNVVTDFVISQMGALAFGCVAEIQKGGGRRFNEVLIVGTGFIIGGGVLKEGTRFKRLGKVTRILSPPGVAFQVAFVALEFKNKSSAIAARDVFGKPGIVAESGSPAPGLPEETIQSFGPPVANARAPIADVPQAILSTVRLSDGRTALWAHIFRFGGATEAETKLLFIEGSPNEGQSLQLRSVSPLKVTNTGTVLLRAIVGEGVDAREGVLVVSGLF